MKLIEKTALTVKEEGEQDKMRILEIKHHISLIHNHIILFFKSFVEECKYHWAWQKH